MTFMSDLFASWSHAITSLFAIHLIMTCLGVCAWAHGAVSGHIEPGQSATVLALKTLLTALTTAAGPLPLMPPIVWPMHLGMQCAAWTASTAPLYSATSRMMVSLTSVQGGAMSLSHDSEHAMRSIDQINSATVFGGKQHDGGSVLCKRVLSCLCTSALCIHSAHGHVMWNNL